MKLKQIVFNSLQRPKSKQKQKHQEQAAKTVKSMSQHEDKKALSFKEVPQKPQTCDLIKSEKTKSMKHSQTAKALENANLMSGYTCISAKPPLPPNTLNINSASANVLPETKCACYKHLTALDCIGLTARTQDHRDAGYSSVSSTEDSGFASLPKTRTLIKTNPWLPSPRSSPNSSPATSPDTSSSSSPSPTVCTDRYPFDSSLKPKPVPERPPQTRRKKKRRDRRVAIEAKQPAPTLLNIPILQDSKYTDYTNVDYLGSPASSPSTDYSPSLLQQCSLSQSDNLSQEEDSSQWNTSGSSQKNSMKCGRSEKGILYTGNQNDNPDRWQYLNNDNFDTSCIGLDSEQLNQYNVGAELLDRPPMVSFQYEVAFESQLEVKGVGQYVDSRDDLSDGLCNQLLNDPLGSRAHDFDSEYCPSIFDSSPGTDFDSETESDETVCDDYYTATGFRGHGRPGPFNDLFRDYYNSSGADSEHDNSSSSDNVWDDPDDKDFDTPGRFRNASELKNKKDLSAQPKKNDRRGIMAQMHLNLERKVSRLRHEENVVSENVAEAQEEEQLRLQEAKRLRRSVNLHRKKLLLRTLQDLKAELEDQSARLQQTYSAVLYMQQAVIEDRRQNHPQQQLQSPVDTREAPF